MVLGRQAHRFETRCAHADELDVRRGGEVCRQGLENGVVVIDNGDPDRPAARRAALAAIRSAHPGRGLAGMLRLAPSRSWGLPTLIHPYALLVSVSSVYGDRRADDPRVFPLGKLDSAAQGFDALPLADEAQTEACLGALLDGVHRRGTLRF